MKLYLFFSAAWLLLAASLHAQDNTAPEVTSIAVPSTVDVSTGPKTINVTLNITDDLSGFGRGFLFLQNDVGSKMATIAFDAAQRTSGDALSGKYKVPVTVPGFVAPATWQFSVFILDQSFNAKTFGSGPDAVDFPIPEKATFQIINTGGADTTPPVASNVQFSPRSGNVTDGPVAIAASFHIADTQAGFDYGYVHVKNPSGEIQNDLQMAISAASRVSGDEHSGNYAIVVTIPQGAMNGSWKVYLGLRDKAGNHTATSEVTINISGTGAGSGDLGDATDATQLDWTTHGNQDWLFQTGTSYDGIDAARSGAIAPGEQSVMEVELTGPGTLTFWWKIDASQSSYLTLEGPDSDEPQMINGNSSWLPATLEIPTGTHTISWTFTRSLAGSSGQNAAWVDRVHYRNNKDREPPTLQRLGISPQVVAIGSEPENVTLSFEVSDDYSGVAGGEARIVAPNGSGMSATFDATNLLPGGTADFGTYEVVLPISPADMVTRGGAYSFGTWKAEITVRDNKAKSRTYGQGHDSFPVAGTSQFTVEEGPGIEESAFAAFASRYSLSGNDALPGANPDNDWAPNALEFLLGLDPTVPSSADPALFQVAREGDELRLDFAPSSALSIQAVGDFLHVSDGAGGAPMQVTGQTSTDLAGPWTNVRPLEIGGGIYRVPLTIGPDGRGFCRLKFIEP